MKPTETAISQYIEGQFPSIFREEGPVLVQFVKAYYEWMESTGQALYHARRLPTYRDIDTTLEEFVTYFKLKYLPNIQFTTTSSKRLFIKNALDFHRSKGSSRSVELFFKLIYGVSANIYYPADDLFKLSDGRWVIPTYLEITPSPLSKSYVGKLVTGVTSFAIAFVEAYNRVRVKGKYIEVFYLSDLSGVFIDGEALKIDGTFAGGPKVVGSLSSFEVVAGGGGFFAGERVGTISGSGQFGTGIVRSTSSIIGAANTELVNGGYGYNSTSEVIISNKTLLVRGIVSNSAIDKLSVIQEFNSNNVAIANAVVVGSSRNHQVIAQLVSGTIQLGQTLTQGSVWGVIKNVTKVGTTLTLDVEDVIPNYISGSLATTPTGVANITSYSTSIGIYNITGSGTFATSSKVIVVGSALEGIIQVSASTSNAMSFRLGANSRFTNLRSANVGLDYILPYANVALNATAYGFTKNAAANSASLMITALRFEDRNYGTIANATITSLYAGSGYTREPFILIKEQLPYDRRIKKFELLVGNQVGGFIAGEKLVTGTANATTGAVMLSPSPTPGVVISSVPNSYVRVGPLSVDVNFYEHDPANYMIIGELSGATAKILKANTYDDPLLNFIGLNADIRAEVFAAAGRVESLSLETSGYGYEDGESLTFFSLTDPTKTGLATISTKTHGVGAGYYMTKGGLPSGRTYFQDNDYYQEFSYEIQTTVQQDTYKQMFDQVLHVAGTKGFSSYLSIENVSSPLGVAESTIEVEV